MQTDALNLDYSGSRTISQPEPVQNRAKRVKVKSRRHSRSHRRSNQPALANTKARNLITLIGLILLLIVFIAGLFYVAYNHFPESEAYPEYQPATEVSQ